MFHGFVVVTYPSPDMFKKLEVKDHAKKKLIFRLLSSTTHRYLASSVANCS